MQPRATEPELAEAAFHFFLFLGSDSSVVPVRRSAVTPLSASRDCCVDRRGPQKGGGGGKGDSRVAQALVCDCGVIDKLKKKKKKRSWSRSRTNASALASYLSHGSVRLPVYFHSSCVS